VIGGLINATFGNAVEVVVAIQALLASEIRIVQASMIGSALILRLMYVHLFIFQIKTYAFLFADEDEEMASLPFWVSMAGLVIVTGVIALISRFLVDSIDGFCESTGVSKTLLFL